MAFRIRQGNLYIFYPPHRIEEFGEYDYLRNGLTVKIKDKDSVIEVFVSEHDIDENWQGLDVRHHAQLTRRGYLPKSVREAALASFNSQTSE